MVTPERVEEVKDLFQDLAKQAADYDELDSFVQSMWGCGDFTDEEYDMIVDHWDEWLPPED